MSFDYFNIESWKPKKRRILCSEIGQTFRLSHKVVRKCIKARLKWTQKWKVNRKIWQHVFHRRSWGSQLFNSRGRGLMTRQIVHVDILKLRLIGALHFDTIEQSTFCTVIFYVPVHFIISCTLPENNAGIWYCLIFFQ